MTEQASTAVTTRRSRRQLLAGGTGALAALLTAESLARPAPASAADGDNLVLGQANSETTVTILTNTVSGAAGLVCFASGAGAGVGGTSDSGDGVSGFAASGNGVHGTGGTAGVVGESITTAGTGVVGSNSTSGIGAAGTSQTGKGVYGQSGATASAMTAGIGVGGITDNLSGIGVLGENTSVDGVGVAGTAAGEFGVGVVASGGSIGVQAVANNAREIAVFGEATLPTGVGVLAANTAGGDALLVEGKAAFSRSGVLTVAAGKSSAAHTRVALTSTSLVLATLQQDRAGVWVRSAVPDVARHSFTVHLNKAAPTRTTVAWFVVN